MSKTEEAIYDDDSIRSLDWKEHIRLRPGMYIGKLGDGSSMDDGIYVLLKEAMDNCIDEYVMGFGKKIEISIKDKQVKVRDYGRGIPLGKVVDVVSKINTGAKYDSVAFKKSVGLNGVGTKAVNALSSYFKVSSVRDGQIKTAEFEKGQITNDAEIAATNDQRGTTVFFHPDEQIFGNYKFINEYVEKMIWNYAYLNTGLSIHFNGQVYKSERGLYDLLEQNLSGDPLYPIIHLKGEDIEIAMTHGNQYSEEYYSFVNGQHTTQGGTHQGAIREAVVKVVRDFYKKDFDANDIRQSIILAISVKVIEPVFESQTKTKLGSQNLGPEGPAIRTFVLDFLKKELDNYLHRHADVSEALLQKILQSEKERKDLSGIRKLARERAKKVSLHNKKLRDCRVHYNSNHQDRLNTTLFPREILHQVLSPKAVM
jgi:topoisomerase-4 subunit B